MSEGPLVPACGCSVIAEAFDRYVNGDAFERQTSVYWALSEIEEIQSVARIEAAEAGVPLERIYTPDELLDD